AALLSHPFDDRVVDLDLALEAPGHDGDEAVGDDADEDDERALDDERSDLLDEGDDDVGVQGREVEAFLLWSERRGASRHWMWRICVMRHPSRSRTRAKRTVECSGIVVPATR